jgi:putative ABC transport system substrate-binding protein
LNGLGFVEGRDSVIDARSAAGQFGRLPKRVEFLHELLPKPLRVGLLMNPGNPAAVSEAADMQATAKTLGWKTEVVSAREPSEIDAALARVHQSGGQALLVSADVFFLTRRKQIVALERRYSLPAVYPQRDFVADGGLLSYGVSIGDANRLAGRYAARILKGEAPADLPVQEASKFELAVNLKTARDLGLTVPPTLIATADEVIE